MKHIEIREKKNCSGCRSCQSVCPKECISMQADSMGLMYPVVDEKKCIECGLCIQTCPFLNEFEPHLPLANYAAINLNETERLKSSSGGVFILLSKRIIATGGVVFGAVFDNNSEVFHKSAKSIEEVVPMMGSKYLQSDTRHTYKEVKNNLEDGKEVLYTGTPCQIAGLNHFLRKDYPSLLTVELICHGVPAPAVWESYLSNKLKSLPSFRNGNEDNKSYSISFRDKTKGWKRYCISITKQDSSSDDNDSIFYERFTDNDYMKAFLRDWSLRPSCYECKTKNGKSQADLTIGDFWGIEKTDILNDDDMGVSCIISRSEKGKKILEECVGLELTEVPYETILKGNQSIEKSVKLTANGKRFHKLFPKNNFYQTIYKIENPSIFYRIQYFIIRHLKLEE